MNPASKVRTLLQGSAFVMAMGLLYFVFRDGRLDEWATGLCYHAGVAGGWPLQHQFWVKVAYEGGSVLTVVWALGIFAVFILGFWKENLRKYRSLTVFCFLLLALGPGLLVNAVFKDNWGRPRPRETVAFGGDQQYQAPLVISEAGGKSFPCGHCSVGFALCVFAFWNQRRPGRKNLVVAGWVAAAFAGVYLGAARVAVGGHYLSDVLAAGITVFAVAWALDTFLPITRWHGATFEKHDGIAEPDWVQRVNPVWIIGSGVILTGMLVFIGLLAFPFHQTGVCRLGDAAPDSSEGDAAMQMPEIADVSGECSSGEIEVVVSGSQIRWEGETHLSYQTLKQSEFQFVADGFGFPWNRVQVTPVVFRDAEDQPWTLKFYLEKKGFFKELRVQIRRLDTAQHES